MKYLVDVVRDGEIKGAKVEADLFQIDASNNLIFYASRQERNGGSTAVAAFRDGEWRLVNVEQEPEPVAKAKTPDVGK
jgi:hypothetical protein